jgi:hypothetical protein
VYKRPTYHESGLPDKVVQWFAGRGIPEQMLIKHRIGYGPVWMNADQREVPAIQFPYCCNGDVINIKYRDGHKHFAQVKDAEQVLYGLDDIEGDQLIITEGEIDKLSVEVAGYASVVSVPNGAPAVDAKSYESKFDYLSSAEARLCELKRIILAVDTDGPGEKLAEELARRLGPERCYRVRWSSGCKDANEVLVSHGAKVLQECIEAAQPLPISGIITIEQIWQSVEVMYDYGLPRGVSPGWSNLARYYTVRPGELTIITGIPSHGKALSLDTPLPTPTGWTTMGAVQQGDWLFDETGTPCQVLRTTEVMYGHPCFEVTFSDGTQVIADADHQWLTNTDKARRSARMARRHERHIPRALRLRGNDQSHKRTYPAVVTTQEMADTLVANGKWNHAIAVTQALDLPESVLPIPPYTLGVWLGDGTRTSGSYSKPDTEIVAFIQADGYVVSERADPDSHGILGLLPQLRQQGLYDNKHIPQQYLRASCAQRYALLEGLLDTDGHITPYGRVEFCTTTPALAYGTFELVASLGFRPVLLTDRARLNGEDYGPRYRITFTPDRPVFRLSRKRCFCKTSAPKSQHRYVVGVKPVASVPVKCIKVNSQSHLYLATQAFIPTHNTFFLSAIMVELARLHQWQLALFSPENYPIKRYTAQLLEQYLGLPFDGYPDRMTKDEMREGLQWLSEHFTFLLPEQKAPTVEHLLELAKVQVYRQGINGLMLDPWNQIDHPRAKGDTETEYISHALGTIRDFARKHDVHVWIIAHPTKLRKAEKGIYSGQYPPPTPYDISGSSHFRNKADNCLTVWRNVDAEDHSVEVHIQKIRFREIGHTGQVGLVFEPKCGRFTEPVVEEDRWKD